MRPSRVKSGVLRSFPSVRPRAALAWFQWSLACVLGACRSRPVPVPAPVPDRPAVEAGFTRGLPAVPEVRGAPLAIAVRYPAPNQLVSARDSNFLLGSVGSGDATLTVNGVPVPVAPNGAFLAWLPLPPAASPRYELVVARGADTARRTLAIRYPVRRALPAAGRLRVDPTSLMPGRGWGAPPA